MNLNEALELAIREIRKARIHAQRNATFMTDTTYKQKLQEEADKYGEAERLLREQIKDEH